MSEESVDPEAELHSAELREPDLEPAPDLPHAASTGDFRVDSALSRLEELAGVPIAEHVAVYDDVHAQLRVALADLDER